MNKEQEQKLVQKRKVSNIVTIALIAFIVFLTILYPFVKPSPKKVFTTTIDTIYSLLEKNIEENEEILKYNLNFQSDLSSTEEEVNRLLQIINSFHFTVDYVLNNNKSTLGMNIASTYKDKNFLNASIHLQENKIYIYLKEVYDKYIEFPSQNFDNFFINQEKQEAFKFIIKKTIEAFKNSLKEEYFSKENTTILLNKEKINVTKNNLLLNEKSLHEILSFMANELEEDAFISSMTKLTDKSFEETKEMIQNLPDKTANLEDSIISIYTKNFSNDFLGISFQNENISIFKLNETSFQLEINTSEMKFSGNIEFITNDEDRTIEITLDTQEINGTITLSLKQDESIIIDKLTPENSISSNDLTKEEAQEILSKFQNNEAIQAISKEFIELFTPHLYM